MSKNLYLDFAQTSRTPEGVDFNNKLLDAMIPVLEKFASEGYSPRDIFRLTNDTAEQAAWHILSKYTC